jgi:hypothetical protein
MLELTQSQRARSAIREFKTITESLAIRGFYRPSGRFGKALENCLRELSPEIYGTMNDPRVVELKGLEYVIDRLPQGIEQATKIILTDEDQFDNTPFLKIEPLKRRRKCYRINNNELCLIISRGISEIYDIVTHMTFLNIEAKKIFKRMHDDYGNIRAEWSKLEKVVNRTDALSSEELDSAIWNMSIILSRNLHHRPLHIISANLHSVVNLIYGYAATKSFIKANVDTKDIYPFCAALKDKSSQIFEFALKRGLYLIPDQSGANIDCQLIDTALIGDIEFHPELNIDLTNIKDKPLILVMDYAFGAQAFEAMEQLLKPFELNAQKKALKDGSISIMGKAGILPGDKGDIMLATAHVCEGTSDNYLFDNELSAKDFDSEVRVYVGPMATVLGTSLQNKDVLTMFMSDWKAVGLEMEGGHYHKAINASIIKGNIPPNTKVRYAYYASDNPLKSGSTLAAGAMGKEGIKPTYMITKVILEKILPIAKSVEGKS